MHDTVDRCSIVRLYRLVHVYNYRFTQIPFLSTYTLAFIAIRPTQKTMLNMFMQITWIYTYVILR